MNAIMGGEPFQFNGNVTNTNLVQNLPHDACVEVPVRASIRGLEPASVGALPAQLAAFTGLLSQIEEMAVEGILTGNQHLIYQAVALSPLSASVLSLAEIQQMVDKLFAVNEPYLRTLFGP